jgi:hypothetical protein
MFSSSSSCPISRFPLIKTKNYLACRSRQKKSVSIEIETFWKCWDFLNCLIYPFWDFSVVETGRDSSETFKTFETSWHVRLRISTKTCWDSRPWLCRAIISSKFRSRSWHVLTVNLVFIFFVILEGEISPTFRKKINNLKYLCRTVDVTFWAWFRSANRISLY